LHLWNDVRTADIYKYIKNPLVSVGLAQARPNNRQFFVLSTSVGWACKSSVM